MRYIGTTEAIDNSKTVTRIVGRQIVEPELTDGILRDRPSSIMRLDRVVENRVLSNEIVRVKVWTAGGRIVYSDKNRLIGSRYPLAADNSRFSTAEASMPGSPICRSRREPVRAPAGERARGVPRRPCSQRAPAVFETYQRFSSIASSGSSIWKAFAPAIIGALQILALLQLPLASSMARRLRRGHAEREALLKQAIDASDQERRRIAGDLHDGVVQSLSGTAFSLAAAAERTGGNGNGTAHEALQRGAAQTRQSVGELRSLMVDIYPPSLREKGLESALLDLTASLEQRGIATELDVPRPAPHRRDGGGPVPRGAGSRSECRRARGSHARHGRDRA
jgi:signal transduction histidine kinase